MYSQNIDDLDSAAPAEECQAFIPRLEDARQIIEDKFLKAGEILTSSISGIETLIGSLDRLAGALDASAVQSVLEDLKAAAEMLNALPDAQAAHSNALKSLDSSRDMLGAHIADMRMSLAYMRAFTVNIKIVAGSLGDLGSDFSLFADDIAGCIQRGTTEMDHLNTGLDELRQRIEAARDQSEVMRHELFRVLPELPRQLELDASATQTHYEKIAQIILEVRDLAKDIRKRSARMLSAQQIGDMTRQRIEHVQTGFRLLGETDLPEDPTQKKQFYGYACAMLAQQLAATVDHFHRETQEIESSMSGIAGDAKQIVDLHGAVYGSGQKEGLLGSLHERISEARDLVGQIAEVDQATRHTGEQTAEAARGLSQQVTNVQLLKNDVQYMALNTTVKCAQIGDAGRPLSVVAVELRDHGRKLEEAATESLLELEHLSALAAELARNHAGAQEKARAEATAKAVEPHAAPATRLTFSEQLDQKTEDNRHDHPPCVESEEAAAALEHTAKRLQDILSGMNAELSNLIHQGDAVMEALDDSSQTLRFQTDIGAVLDAANADLLGLCAASEPCPPEISGALSVYFADMAKTYTMAQERTIQRDFLDAIALAPEAPADTDTQITETAANSSDEDEFDDVFF